MESIASARAFIARCQRDEPVDVLTAAFETALQRMGFRLFACVSHTDPLIPTPGAVLVHNYPEPWVRLYIESGLHAIDAVLQHADRSLLPFSWEVELRGRLTRPQQEIFAAARPFGIEKGYTIPIHIPQTFGIPSGSCSVVPDAHPLDDESYLAASLMAPYFYHAVSRATAQATSAPPVLSRRQRECLALVAQGKDDWTIGQLLNISEHTVHAYVESAKRRLGVTTRAQAVAQALLTGQLSGDDCRTLPRRSRSPNVIIRNTSTHLIR